MNIALGLLVIGLAVISQAEEGPSVSFLGEGTDKLSLSILKNEAENRTNLVFSPLGYSVILAILTEGSRGETRNQLASYLNYPEDTYAARTTYKAVLSLMQEKNQPNQPQFKNWFYVYKNYSVEDAYRNVIEDNFLTKIKTINRDGTDIEEEEGESGEQPEETTDKPLSEVDVKGETTTVMTETQQRVKKSLEHEIMAAISANRLSSSEDNSTDPESRMIIFNALYYRGQWASNFTEVEGGLEFECADGVKKSVPSIKSNGEFEYGRVRQLRATAVNIPHEGGRYSLLLVLPERGDSLVTLIKRLPKMTLSQIERQLTKRQVKVTIPKIKFYRITRPKEALQKDGVEDVFGEKADLSGISGEKGLYLDDLVQLVTIDLNQDSAKYNYLTTTNVLRQTVPEFIAQRPFLFFLRDKIDNFVVVAGKVEDPSEQS